MATWLWSPGARGRADASKQPGAAGLAAHGLLAEWPVHPQQKHDKGGNRRGWLAALSQDTQCGQPSALQREIPRRSRSA